MKLDEMPLDVLAALGDLPKDPRFALFTEFLNERKADMLKGALRPIKADEFPMQQQAIGAHNALAALMTDFQNRITKAYNAKVREQSPPPPPSTD